MEADLRERVARSLEATVPRVAALVARTDCCWGDIAVALEQMPLSLRERGDMRDALVALGDRNVLLLLASLYGPEFLGPRQPDLPPDLQRWLVAEGLYAKGLCASAERLAEERGDLALARERDIFRAGMKALRGHYFPVPA